MEKTLYFEGAGWADADTSKATDVGNCRIRTAFHNDKGEAIYLELTSCEVSKHSAPSLKKYTFAGFVDSCHYILGYDDENKHCIHHRNSKTFEYTKANILKFVNSLGCSFSEVVILPDLAGYRVFKDRHGEYNFGDEFVFNAEVTARANEIESHFYALEKSEGKQYPNFSLWVDEDDKGLLHLLRHFPKLNRHWTIRADVANWQDTVKEAVLGQYAC